MVKLTLRRLTEQTLAVLLLLAFIMPLLLTAIRSLPLKPKWSRFLDHAWIGSPHLNGITAPMPDAPLSWLSLQNTDFQKRKAREFNEGFAGREAFIRLTNELWFRLFHDTTNPLLDITIGRHDVLFGKGYLEEYFRFREDKSAFEPWVKDLRRLQDYCRNIGMGFVVVLTPSKVSIYPEDVPDGWQRCHDPRPRACVLLKELFHENGIFFVDATELVAEEKLKGPPAPLFPKGGVHWNWRASLVAANAVQACFAAQGKQLLPIESAGSSISNKPIGIESDLLDLLNLVRKWSYPCERLEIKRREVPPSARLSLTAVGGSFTWELLRQFSASGQYSDVDCYFYYKLYKTRETAAGSETVRKPATPIDFNREVFAADCLLLELNEASAAPRSHHLSAFITDALAHLPNPGAPRAAFHAD